MPIIPDKSKPGPKFTKTEYEEKLALAAKMERRGHNQFAIAEVLGVSQPQVCYYLKTVRERYKDSQLEDRGELVKVLLSQIDEVMTEAWKAWDESKENKERIITEEITSANAMGIWTKNKTGRELEGRSPNASYLSIIMECIKRKCMILGIDAPKKVTATVNNVSWDMMAKEDVRGKSDNLERLISEASVVDVKIIEGESNGDNTDIGIIGSETNGKAESN